MKNTQAKMRTVENPYEVWKSKDGSWTWKVLKKHQEDDNKPYARWFCAVSSPFTFGSYDMGDVYVKEIKENAVKVEDEFARDSEGKISSSVLSEYGRRQLDKLHKTSLPFSDDILTVEGNLLKDASGNVIMTIDNDRLVNKIMFKLMVG